MTEAVVQKLEEAFMIDATDGEACAFANIAESTYYLHRQQNLDFSERMDRAKQFPFMLAKKTVMQALKAQDGPLAMKWLKNRQRDRYHEKVEQDVKQTSVEDVLDQVEGNANYSGGVESPREPPPQPPLATEPPLPVQTEGGGPEDVQAQ